MEHQKFIWAVLAVTVPFLVTQCQGAAATCETTSQDGGVGIFNCSQAGLDALPEELPVEAQVLDFSRNRFTSFPKVPESPSCHMSCGAGDTDNPCRLHISFSNNQIESFEPYALNELKCLQTLDLSFNDIKAEIFHPDFFEEGAYYLQRLNLRGNPLGRLPDSVITHPFMRYLRHLDVSSCELTELGRNSVDDFPDLMILDLSENKLSDIHADTFKGLKRLDELDLSDNQLTFFSEHIFGDLVGLRDLRLNGNSIKGFHDDAFYRGSNLLNLDLTNNQLQDVPYAAINKLTKLKTLTLSNNPIKKVTASASVIASDLESLLLDDMPLLTEIEPDDLAAFSHLVSLSIRGGKNFNKIRVGPSPNLRLVSLEDNWISTMESDALPWKQLEVLELGGNPWLCDDRLRWMIEADCIKGPVICEGPGNLRGLDLKTLKSADLKTEVTIVPMATIVISLLAVPVICACAVFVWRRRRFCLCSQRELQGRYVSVFTRDGDEENDVRVDVRLRENAKRIIAVSNGGADDSKHLVKLEKTGGSNEGGEDTEEEEI